MIVVLKSSTISKTLFFIGAIISVCIQFPTFPSIPTFVTFPSSSFSPKNHFLNLPVEAAIPDANPITEPTIGPPINNPITPPAPAPSAPMPKAFFIFLPSSPSSLLSFPKVDFIFAFNLSLNPPERSPSSPISPYMKFWNISDFFNIPSPAPNMAPAIGPPTSEPRRPPELPKIKLFAIPRAAPPMALFLNAGSLNMSCVFLEINPPTRLLFPSSSSTSGPNK